LSVGPKPKGTAYGTATEELTGREAFWRISVPLWPRPGAAAATRAWPPARIYIMSPPCRAGRPVVACIPVEIARRTIHGAALQIAGGENSRRKVPNVVVVSRAGN